MNKHDAVGKRQSGTRFLVTLIGASVAVSMAGPAWGWVMDQQATVNFKSKQQYGGVPYQEVRLPLIDNFDPSLPFGGIVGGVGLYAGAGGHADLDLVLRTWFNNSLDLAAAAKQRTFLFSLAPEPTIGDSFFLHNEIDSLGIQKLLLSSGNLYAQAGIDMELSGWAKAKACLGFCVSAGIKLTANTFVELAKVSNGGLSVFGETLDSTAPFQYTDPSGLFSASANLPSFSKSFTGILPGLGVSTGWMQEPVLSANLDVAELIAKAAGFSIPLEGDLLGFGYEIFSLDAFAGVDMRQLLKFNAPTLATQYEFSSPVEMFDSSTNSWTAPLTKLTLADGQGAELRSAGAANIGVTSAPTLNYKIDYDADFALKAGIDLSALELHGFGISLGPLIDPDPWQLNLGSLDIDSGTDNGKTVAKAGAVNLHFEHLKVLPPDDDGVSEIVDLCLALGGCTKEGYVTAELLFPDLGLVEQTTRRVFNFGTDGCNDLINIDCDFDLDFEPIVRQRRGGGGDPLLPWYDDTDLLARLAELGFVLPGFDAPLLQDYGGDFADDFNVLDAFLAAAPPPEGPTSNDALMDAALEDLGVDLDNPFPTRPPRTGAPYEALYGLTEDRSGDIAFAVPEPSLPALLAAALPAGVWWRRRRRS